MARKRLTQMFPWLIPIRKKQRLFCFHMRMRLDANHYAITKTEKRLPYRLFETSYPLYNTETGFDMVYQENKVFNLKLAADTIDNLLIRPGETFSFWRLARYADRITPYKEGLTLINGKLLTIPGGGMCHISNLLFYMFLHAPLTIVERHGHGTKDFPDLSSDALFGIDATISEGWLDLKVRNETDETFQIHISFDSQHIIGGLFTDRNGGIFYKVTNGKPSYYRKGEEVFEEVDVIQTIVSDATNQSVSSKRLYRNKCKIGYPLPAGTRIIEKG